MSKNSFVLMTCLKETSLRQLVLTFSKFVFGGLTKNPVSTNKNGIIKIQKFLNVRPPADTNLVLWLVKPGFGYVLLQRPPIFILMSVRKKRFFVRKPKPKNKTKCRGKEDVAYNRKQLVIRSLLSK